VAVLVHCVAAFVVAVHKTFVGLSVVCAPTKEQIRKKSRKKKVRIALNMWFGEKIIFR
jgi:hypothetical protein